MFHVKHNDKDNIIQVHIGRQAHAQAGAGVDRTRRRLDAPAGRQPPDAPVDRRASAQGEIFTGGEQSDGNDNV